MSKINTKIKNVQELIVDWEKIPLCADVFVYITCGPRIILIRQDF